LPATASSTIRMTVWSQQLPVAGLSVTPGDTVCQGTAVTLSAVPVYGGTAPTYTWMKNGASAGTAAAYTYVPADGDMLYLSMTSTYPCRTVSTVLSNVITMAVDTPEMPIVSITASPGILITLGLYDTLTASVTNGGPNPQYQWVVNEVPVAGATNSTFVSNDFQYPNQDSVTCLVTSDVVCSATSFGWVYVNAHPEGVTMQTVNGGGFTILPNPNTGSFTIKGSLGTGTDQEVTIEITDLLGQTVYREKVMAPGGKVNEQITLSQTTANGMYLLNLRSGDANSVFHVVVER
jgi:Secretion system C-terminal sorting domain